MNFTNGSSSYLNFIFNEMFSLQFSTILRTCNISEMKIDAIRELLEHTKCFVGVSRIEMVKVTKGTEWGS